MGWGGTHQVLEKTWALSHSHCLGHDLAQLDLALAGPPERRSRGLLGSEPNSGIPSDLAPVTST